jgi:hypothetical protein
MCDVCSIGGYGCWDGSAEGAEKMPGRVSLGVSKWKDASAALVDAGNKAIGPYHQTNVSVKYVTKYVPFYDLVETSELMCCR